MEEKLKSILRIANTDLNGNKPIYHALRKIKGVDFMFSNAICKVNNIDPNKKTGALTPQEIKAIENTLQDPKNIPTWLFNRKKDYDTGKDTHLTTAKLKLQKEFDIKRLQKVKSYKGLRHAWGLPVRGQKTKGHFRKGRAVGVVKKAARALQAAKGKPKEKSKK